MGQSQFFHVFFYDFMVFFIWAFVMKGEINILNVVSLGHMLINWLISEGAFGEVKSSIASSSTPVPNGDASLSTRDSGTRIGQNRLYDLVSWQESKALPDVITVCYNSFLLTCIVFLIWSPLFPI